MFQDYILASNLPLLRTDMVLQYPTSILRAVYAIQLAILMNIKYFGTNRLACMSRPFTFKVSKTFLTLIRALQVIQFLLHLVSYSTPF